MNFFLYGSTGKTWEHWGKLIGKLFQVKCKKELSKSWRALYMVLAVPFRDSEFQKQVKTLSETLWRGFRLITQSTKGGLARTNSDGGLGTEYGQLNVL